MDGKEHDEAHAQGSCATSRIGCGKVGLLTRTLRRHLMNKQSVSAQEFVLNDAEGNKIASLAACRDGRPLLQMFDRQGIPRMSIGLNANDHPQIAIRDPEGNVGVGLGQRSDGALGINVADATGMIAVSAFVREDGTREIIIRDKDGVVVHHLCC